MRFIHPTASVGSASIGENTRIWQYVVLGGDNISIGENCNICAYCFIEDGVHIGSNVLLKMAFTYGQICLLMTTFLSDQFHFLQ